MASFGVHKSLLDSASVLLSSQIEHKKHAHGAEYLTCEIGFTMSSAVETYVHWLYSGKMSGPLAISKPTHTALHFYHDAFDFAFRIYDLNLMDAVLDQTLACIKQAPSPFNRFQELFDLFKMMESPKMLVMQLMLDLAIFFTRETGCILDLTEATGVFKDFERDLGRRALTELSKFGSDKKADNPFTVDSCVYHKHTAEGLPCYKEKFAARSITL